MAIQKITAKIIADGAIIATDIADGSITTAKIADANVTAAKIISVANTQVTGLITASQIAAVNGAVITANTIANSAFQTGSVENYMSAQNLGIGMRNRIINGDMRFDQRYAGTATANTINGYVLDRWYVGQVGGSTGKIIAQQNAGSVTPPAGFSNYLGITSQSAYSVGASQQYSIQQPIEGYNVADLAWGTASAKTITLSFFVRSSLTGTFAISLRNATPNRSYVSTYTISSANTWEQKSITIAGDTSGTWNATNSAGIYVDIDLGSGSSLSTTANTWTTGNYTTTSGVTNLVGTNGATLYITGVQLEVGSTATPFERRLYGQELALCQRYYWKNKGDGAGSGPYGIGHCRSNYLRGIINLPVTMRTTPSMTNTGTDADYIVDSGTSDFTSFVTRPSLDSGGPNMLNFRVQVSTGMTNGYAARLSCNSSSSFLAFDAEL